MTTLRVSSIRKLWCSLCLTEGGRGSAKKVMLENMSKAKASIMDQKGHTKEALICAVVIRKILYNSAMLFCQSTFPYLLI